MMILGITGKARAGKDTVGEYLARRYGFTRYAMAGPLKAMVAAGFGLLPEYFETTEQKEAVIPWLGVSYRHLCQTIGTEWGRECVHPEVWIRVAEKVITGLAARRHSGVAITDIRFENEADMVRRHGGTVIHVLSNRGTPLAAAAQAHRSEAGVQIKGCDYTLHNYTTIAELYGDVDRIVASLKGVQLGDQ